MLTDLDYMRAISHGELLTLAAVCFIIGGACVLILDHMRRKVMT